MNIKYIALLVVGLGIAITVSGCGSPPSQIPSEPLATPALHSPIPDDFQRYSVPKHGFEIGYPADWKIVAEHWVSPTVDSPIQLMANFENESATQSFAVEISDSGYNEFAKAYLRDKVSNEDIEVNGYPVMLVKDSYNQLYYIFTNPNDTDVRVVFVAPAETTDPALIDQVLATFKFVG
jgi:hypothetical protein